MKSHFLKRCSLSERLKIRVLLFKARTLKLNSSFGFGTLLRNFAEMFGITFDQENMFKAHNRRIHLCNELSNAERKFHDIMLMLGQSYGVNASLHDFPNFQKIAADAKEEGEARIKYPFYSLCQFSDR